MNPFIVDDGTIVFVLTNYELSCWRFVASLTSLNITTHVICGNRVDPATFLAIITPPMSGTYFPSILDFHSRAQDTYIKGQISFYCLPTHP